MCSLLKIGCRSHNFKRCCSAFAPEVLLGDENKRKTIDKFSKTKSVKMQSQRPTRSAAVLVPLCVVDGKTSLLYTLRAANLKSHKNQISFPGGMEDPTDRNPEDTALRETEEEIGLDKKLVNIWGRGGGIINRGATSVTPVIGVCKGDLALKKLRVNTSEVKEVFTVPVEELCDVSNVRHTQFRPGLSLPVFTVGKRRIWGLTAVITHLVLKSLLPKDAYCYNVKCIPPLKATLPYRLL